MVDITGKGQNDNGLNDTSGELSDKRRKDIDTYSLLALFCFISSEILIALDHRLLAGCLIISGTVIGIILFKKISSLNKQIKESLKISSSLNERKDNVIIDFSHKIREPLNNLVIISDMFRESGLQKKQKELLDTFIASTNNMVTTVNELTMQSAGNLSYETRKHIRFNLLSTIQNTIELYNLKDRANIDFILNKKEFGDIDCFGDPIILKQIFLDLFNTIENQNSERATKVTINLRKEKDTGTESFIGLRIQTDRKMVLIDDKGNERSLAARFISSSKGSYSQETGNNYTVLNILLPFSSPVIGSREKISSRSVEELAAEVRLHKELKDLNILLVEDNLINQKITLITLDPLVSSIDTALDGKEAVDKFGLNKYDLILMDIQMPVMNGLEAAEKIRVLESSTGSHIPIIAITANAMIGDQEKCLSAGMDDYITKPYLPAALIGKIKKFI